MMFSSGSWLVFTASFESNAIFTVPSVGINPKPLFVPEFVSQYFTIGVISTTMYEFTSFGIATAMFGLATVVQAGTFVGLEPFSAPSFHAVDCVASWQTSIEPAVVTVSTNNFSVAFCTLLAEKPAGSALRSNRMNALSAAFAPEPVAVFTCSAVSVPCVPVLPLKM
jgi:hypothetical protein